MQHHALVRGHNHRPFWFSGRKSVFQTSLCRSHSHSHHDAWANPSIAPRWAPTVVVARSLSSVSGRSSGCGGPAEFHPRRNISGFVDLAPLGATAPAGKGCVCVDPLHASLYVSFSCHFRLWFSSTSAGQGSWVLPTTGTSPVAGRPSG